jgi:hypothetical protein
MTHIPLLEKSISFRTDMGFVVRAIRSYVTIEFTDSVGNILERLAMVDSGAPFSVVPYSLWHEQNLNWNPLASQFLRSDNQVDVAALTWQGVPCRLGEIPIRLVDQQGDARSRPLLLTAKFALSQIRTSLEKEVILGDSFIVDNLLTLSLRGIGGKLDGAYTLED